MTSGCGVGEVRDVSQFGVIITIGAGVARRGEVGGGESPSRSPRGVLPNTDVGCCMSGMER